MYNDREINQYCFSLSDVVNLNFCKDKLTRNRSETFWAARNFVKINLKDLKQCLGNWIGCYMCTFLRGIDLLKR